MTGFVLHAQPVVTYGCGPLASPTVGDLEPTSLESP